MAPWRRPGFTLPGNAAAAARKGHELGTLHQWTEEEARRQGRIAAEKRWAKVREQKAREVAVCQ